MPPSIVAFDVTPTSGTAPYTFTADLGAAVNIDDKRYSLLFQSTTAVGSCPPLGSATNVPNGVDALLATGQYISNDDVPVGSCRTYTLRIRDNVLGTFIASESVQVSNV